MDAFKIGMQGFSDTVIAYVPTAARSGKLSLYNMGSMLISVSATMLMSLVRGQVVAAPSMSDSAWNLTMVRSTGQY